MVKRDILIWKFIDGRCSPSERKIVESWLETDPQFRKEYKLAMTIHKALQETNPAEVPFNFANSVVAKIQKTSQTKPKYQTGLGPIFSIIALVWIGFLITPFLFPDQFSNEGVPFVDQWMRSANDVFTSFHIPYMKLIAALSVSSLALLWLDFILKKLTPLKAK